MSNSLIELELQYDYPYLNHFPNLYFDTQNFSNISSVSKSKFAEHYHYLCKYCGDIPVIK